jgi:hypothetical protein
MTLGLVLYDIRLPYPAFYAEIVIENGQKPVYFGVVTRLLPKNVFHLINNTTPGWI